MFRWFRKWQHRRRVMRIVRQGLWNGDPFGVGVIELGESKEPWAFKPLMSLFERAKNVNYLNNDINGLNSVIHAFGNLGDRRAIPTLISELRGECYGAASAALEKLIDSRDVDLLTGLISDADLSAPVYAGNALARLNDSTAIKALVALVGGPAQLSKVRGRAGDVLRRMKNKSATVPLIGVLKTADAEGRRIAAWTLGHLNDRSCVDALEAALGDDDPDVRRCAAWALAILGSSTPLSKSLEGTGLQNFMPR